MGDPNACPRQPPSPPADAAAASPWFCHDLDCPRFSLQKNLTDLGIELRRYPAAKWVSTNIEGASYDKAVATGFWCARPGGGGEFYVFLLNKDE
jgi:hypothetical protein